MYYNLAWEEFLVKNANEDFLLFYINSDAVVLGKHQNPWLEVNPALAKENNIAVARRLSGGGTVFHDLGNINFSFIRNKERDFVNFREHIEPISQALHQLGIVNRISERNDIFINEYKVSGNAEHVNNTTKRILHHGTLLYNANLQELSKNTKPIALNIKTHAVASVRSKVQNIKEIADFGTSMSFLEELIKILKNKLKIDIIYNYNPEENLSIQNLVISKYNTWEWNYGYTPQFEFTDEKGILYKIRKGNIIESSDLVKIGQRCDTILP